MKILEDEDYQKIMKICDTALSLDEKSVIVTDLRQRGISWMQLFVHSMTCLDIKSGQTRSGNELD